MSFVVLVVYPSFFWPCFSVFRDILVILPRLRRVFPGKFCREVAASFRREAASLHILPPSTGAARPKYL